LRKIAKRTGICYVDVQNAVRPLKKNGEVVVVGSGGVWGNAERLALVEGK
jgi:hypothetical protein